MEEKKKKMPTASAEPSPKDNTPEPDVQVQPKNNLAEDLIREIYMLKKSMAKLQENNEMLSQLISVNSQNASEEIDPNEALVRKLMRENQAYKQLAVQRIKDMVYSKVKAEFPEIEYNSFEDFPEEFHRLVCARVSPAIAYKVVAGKKDLKKPEPIGKVKENGDGEKDFYTSSEVDKLTKKQLSNPKVMETVLKSMLKW